MMWLAPLHMSNHDHKAWVYILHEEFLGVNRALSFAVPS